MSNGTNTPASPIAYVANWVSAPCPKCQQSSWSVSWIPIGTNYQGTVLTQDILACRCGVCGYFLYMKPFS